MDYINKEDRQNIKKLNLGLGMNHRSKPYDFKSPEDILEATTMATAEYMDINHYWLTLYNLDESFDESLEYFDTASWINIGLKGTTSNKKIDAAIKSLQKTENLFYDLLKTAELKCADMWKIVFFNSPDSVSEYFFGKILQYKEEVIEKGLLTIFELSSEIEYNSSIAESVQNFINALLKNLELIENAKDIDI